jgi:hypothetical protein
MKRILVLFCLYTAFGLKAEKYVFSGAETLSPVKKKSEISGYIELKEKDSLAILLMKSDSLSKPSYSKIISRKNDKILLRQGNNQHTMIITKKKGQFNGVDYTHEVSLSIPLGGNNFLVVVYYCTKEE